ncbi:Peptidase_M14 domain-containing protein [Meloidogyne graminicola]|uniref:Peptidase_M14 domain-containing protein n=1 Tax=Meloidogyne graminicola TaxID=189291 RepID=A0A8T0A0P8_9BILA|nr:Peptidase_M14 domain-containing protein [Meloidogyne graminicola]
MKMNYQKYFPEFNNNNIIKKLIFDEINNEEEYLKEYNKIVLNKWKKINSVGSFIKIANPELFDCSDKINENKQSSFKNLSNNNIIKEIINENIFNYNNKQININNNKEEKKKIIKYFLEFRFESGNLWKAIQVEQYKYQLIISPDINQQNIHFQWFYFEISNMEKGIPYNFEIINCLKNISMFSKGMQPVLFSTIEAEKYGRIGWIRAGTEINYFKNLYKIPNLEINLIKENNNNNLLLLNNNNKRIKKSLLKNKNICNNKLNNQNNNCCDNIKTNEIIRNFSSLYFTLYFPHNEDHCYIAYHFPYTYTRLQCTIERWISSTSLPLNIFFWRQKLCNTLSGNCVPILTITNYNKHLKSKQIILITSRVHPGESNSSWIIHGFIQFLLSTHPLANRARDIFIFKLIPMLNPDGVINGSHRCSLTGQDLNRVWNCPSPIFHPSIFNTKALIQYMVEILKIPPFSFIDLHGHSRKANIFMYGNNPMESWCSADNSFESKTFSLLPEILSKFSDSFSLKDCSFSITKAKEFSARVSTWRQFNLERVYTCESSYWGFDFGSKSGTQITIADLKRMGTELVEGLVHLYDIHINELNKNINKLIPNLL